MFALDTTKAAHTPGPWTVDLVARYQGEMHFIGADILGRDGGTVVAEVRGAVKINGQEHGENTANASLIAAAPELLAALNLVDDEFAKASAKGVSGRPTVGQLNTIWVAVRAAIAKAGGV